MTVRTATIETTDLVYTAEVAERTAAVFEKVAPAISAEEWPDFAPYIDEIIRLKQERNAIILAHNYQTRDIYHCVSDIVGDSLALAQKAMDVEADVIVMAGVHFMAETTKLMNPGKTVLIPDPKAGCSLADSITGEDVRNLRKKYPGVPIVTYVNTSVEVKAESDICCTSANAKKIVESLGVDRVLLIPDRFLAANVAAETEVEILTWEGECEVHERFTAQQVTQLRKAHPGVTVLAHPECPPEVVRESDFSGSTAAMINFVVDKKPAEVALITECSMGDNIAAHNPDTKFIRSCNLCPHMQRINLMNICDSLRHMTHEVTIDPELAEPARRAVQRMLDAS
ncbi:quinolinate synthase NadA [Kiloniella laminariae]|uniref:Quinolinate synthase n=1 Tax=Kiloniella laminariae TaxID=454162 RepID=A0ABT4LIL4_9PROT|nr:quinolinate synthase NadA [Kiloniella laminariae]MCZ4280926.1 quinolinate synthase NadA [Kiloniella laminariae]